MASATRTSGGSELALHTCSLPSKGQAPTLNEWK